MTKFSVPTKEKVSSQNREIFEALEKKVGFLPNIYATYALSDHALERYLNFQNGKSSLSMKEKEAVNLAVSQVNGCNYCLAAHTAMGKMVGYSEDQILEIRQGNVSGDVKLDALVNLVQNIVKNRGKVDGNILDAYFEAGYDQGNLVDLILAVGEKTITNYLHKITDIPIDFPEAPALETADVNK